jgi:hypothetical protein
LVSRSQAVPYAAPFVIFLALIGLSHLWPMPALADEIFRLAVMLGVLFLVARPVLRGLRILSPGVSVLVGVAIFSTGISSYSIIPWWVRRRAR